MPQPSIRKIVIAVDFGTTMSGVAFAQTARPEVQSVLTQWSDQYNKLDGVSADKVPSQVVYDGPSFRAGFEITDDEPRHQWFKLGLDKQDMSKVSHLSNQYPDPKALPVSFTKTAVSLSTDFLKWLYEHIIRVLTNKFGATVVETTSLDFILTVPAIWSEKAKRTTSSIAYQAGMGAEIQLISEPEAAVLYTLDVMDPSGLCVGDTFILCDAGGGTVDLISYKVTGLKPRVVVEEAAPGSGSACGSTFLNRIFQAHVRKLVQANEGYGEDTLSEAMDRFETIIKRRFDGSETNVYIPVPGLMDDEQNGIRRGKMTISGASMRKIFEPVMSAVTTLVQAQINVTGTAKAVLLVGGFGQSPYLRECIRKVVDPDIKVIQPPNGQTAIVRGALIRGLAKLDDTASRIKLSSRVARLSFGTCVRHVFDGTKHVKSLRRWDAYRGEYTVSAMDWFLLKGQKVDESKPFKLSYYLTRKVTTGKIHKHTQTIMRLDRGIDIPMYPSSNIPEHVTLRADLSTIPRDQIPTKIGADGKKYYYFSYHIHVNHFSASTEYSLWYEGKCYGKVSADYA